MGENIHQVLGDIEVSDLGNSLSEEYVGWFDVSVDDVVLVESIQSFQGLVGHFPDVLFRDPGFGEQCLLDAILG